MGFLRRILGKHRRHDRLDIRLSVRVETEVGNGKEFWTEDISASGLRMDISPLSSVGDLTGGLREVWLSITLNQDDEPVQVSAEPIWTTGGERDGHSSGWMFCKYRGDARDRLAALVGAGG